MNIEEIRARWDDPPTSADCVSDYQIKDIWKGYKQAFTDIAALLGEVERLKVELKEAVLDAH